MLGIHLPLLGLEHLTLLPLVLRILTHKTEATVHLGKILRREDKHQLILHGLPMGQRAQAADVFTLTVAKLGLKRSELRLKHLHVAVQSFDILFYSINIALAFPNLRVECLQMLEPRADVGLVLLECPFLLLNLLLNLAALLFQPFDGSIGVYGALCSRSVGGFAFPLLPLWVDGGSTP